MVAQAVAAAVAPVAIQSATESDGLINKAFKIVIIASLLATFAIIIYVISLLGGAFDIELSNILGGGLINAGLSFIGLGSFQAGGPFSYWGLLLTGAGALAIRR